MDLNKLSISVNITSLILIILFITLVMFGQNKAQAQEVCRIYTMEQQEALDLAYIIGYEYDLGYTLAAIVKQESFIGDNIVRINNRDGKHGSYGITHINLETGMHFTGVSSRWEALADLAPKLITNDVYALEMGLQKLLSRQHLGWSKMVRSYNGNARIKATELYLNKIKKHLKELQTCVKFEQRFAFTRAEYD